MGADADPSAAVLRAEVRRILGEQTPELLGTGRDPASYGGNHGKIPELKISNKDVEHGNITDFTYIIYIYIYTPIYFYSLNVNI